MRVNNALQTRQQHKYTQNIGKCVYQFERSKKQKCRDNELKKKNIQREAIANSQNHATITKQIDFALCAEIELSQFQN